MVEHDPQPESKPEELSEEERQKQFELMKSAISRSS
jgi:hypothetical protein